MKEILCSDSLCLLGIACFFLSQKTIFNLVSFGHQEFSSLSEVTSSKLHSRNPTDISTGRAEEQPTPMIQINQPALITSKLE